MLKIDYDPDYQSGHTFPGNIRNSTSLSHWRPRAKNLKKSNANGSHLHLQEKPKNPNANGSHLRDVPRGTIMHK